MIFTKEENINIPEVIDFKRILFRKIRFDNMTYRLFKFNRENLEFPKLSQKRESIIIILEFRAVIINEFESSI